jgi:uncharacterized RDD family membrane protein YckC
VNNLPDMHLPDQEKVTAPVPQNTVIDHERLPSLAARVKAVFIDFAVLLMLFSLISVFVNAINDVNDFLKGSLAIALLVLYDPLLTAFTGGTLGHKALGLRVKKYAATDKNISLIDAFIRFIVKGALGWLSFLTVTMSSNKRAIHDTLSGSIVLG